ncbi:MAG: sugar phosphate isomerase/epimerase [Defluviitaleaceae bacterium]|nr:sugar phosphate isomerase/epimerase [Defluviitaleaceae bacterium]
MKIGVTLHYDEYLPNNFKWCTDNGIFTCQLSVGTDKLTDETADHINELCRANKMEITALVGCWSGPGEWNFTAGPLTLGIVPAAYRFNRMRELMACARFAPKVQVRDVCTHMGFIPENPCDALYGEVVAAIRYLAHYYKDFGLRLNMETGQETPIVLLRVINDVGTGNLGINFDPANFLMYGKANPIDAVKMLGPYINGVHAKDGEYPTNGAELGKEKPLGEGRVGIQSFVQAIKDVGYKGAITIEREISGEQQKIDMLAAKALLEKLL